MEYWKNYWKIIGDPFSSEPLNFSDDGLDRLIVHTESVDRIESLISGIKYGSLTKRFYLVGQRGMGKTTLVNFFIKQLLSTFHNQRVLPIFINTITESQSSNELRKKFVESTIESLFEMVIIGLSRIQYDDTQIIEKFRDLRKKYLNEKGKGIVDISTGEQLLYHLLSTLQDKRMGPFLLFYDELDKLDNYSIVLDFLRKSQSFIENLTGRYGCTVVIAGIPEWVQLLSTDEYSGVRGELISLNPWDVEDAELLIELRLKYAIMGSFANPFTHEVIDHITKQAQGRPRKILEHVKAMLIWGANKNIKQFKIDECKKLFWNDSAILRLYNEISSQNVLRDGFDKLSSIYDPDKDDPSYYEILTLIYQVKKYPILTYSELRKRYGIDIGDKTHRKILSRLEAMGAIEKKQDAMSYYSVNKEIGILFDYVMNNLNESLDFLPYIIKTKKPEVVAKIEFSLRNEIIKILEGKPTIEYGIKDILDEILNNPEAKARGKLYYQSSTDLPSDVILKRKMRLGGNSVLNSLIKQGYVLKTQKNKLNYYRWLPKYINIGNFAHLAVHDSVIRDLEAAGQNFSVGLYEPCISTCRSAIENSLRRLYREKKKSPCPKNLTLDAINNKLLNDKVYDRGIHSYVLGFAMQTNPIVHREVAEISEELARALFDLAQTIIKEIYKIM